MGLRFRRTFKIMPGVRINLSKSGVSTTIGPRGAHTTISSRRVTNTVDIPGSGLSYSSTATVPHADAAPRSSTRAGVLFAVLAFVIAAACYVNESPSAGAVFVVVGLLFLLPSLIAQIGGR